MATAQQVALAKKGVARIEAKYGPKVAEIRFKGVPIADLDLSRDELLALLAYCNEKFTALLNTDH